MDLGQGRRAATIHGHLHVDLPYVLECAPVGNVLVDRFDAVGRSHVAVAGLRAVPLKKLGLRPVECVSIARLRA